MFENCSCTKTCAQYIQMEGAGLPLRLQRWEMSQLSAEFVHQNKEAVNVVNEFSENLVQHVDAGEGLFLWSGHGLAKSSIAGALLKRALGLGISSYYTSGSDLLSLMFKMISDDAAQERVETLMSGAVKLVVIDEIDKVYTRDSEAYAYHAFTRLFTSFYNHMTSLIVCSNQNIDTLRERSALDESILDRLRGLHPVLFRGASYRGHDDSNSAI